MPIKTYIVCLFTLIPCFMTSAIAEADTVPAARTITSITSSAPTRGSIGRLPIQTWQTKNGVKVFFASSPELPMLDIRLVFPAGSAYDAGQSGVASLTNTVLTTGSKTQNADQIATQFDQLGVILSNSANQDYAVIGLRSLNASHSLDPAITLLTQILASPSFSSTQVNRLKKQTLSEIQAEEQDPSSVAGKIFFNGLYGKQGYGHPLLGTTKTVAALTRDDLLRFYQQHYTAAHSSLILVGNISDVQAKTIAEQLSQALSTQNTNSQPTSLLPHATQAHCSAFNFPSAQANILIGEIGIARNDPDFFPLVVGNHILGGGALTSRLFQEVRNKKGLAYSVSSRFIALKEKGPFLISLQSRNEKGSEALQTVHDNLSQFRQEGPSDEELSSAKRNLIGKFNVNLASNNAITSALTTLAFYQLPLNYFDTYAQNIQAVTLEQVKQAMQKHLHPDQLLTVIVGKATCPSAEKTMTHRSKSDS